MPEWEEREDEKGRQAGESAPSNLGLCISLKVGKTSNDLTHSDVSTSSAFIVRLTKMNLGWNGRRERARKWRLLALEVSFISIAVSTTPLRAAKISHRRRKGGSPIKVLSAHTPSSSVSTAADSRLILEEEVNLSLVNPPSTFWCLQKFMHRVVRCDHVSD